MKVKERTAPFEIDTIKSINHFQRDGRFSPILCDCGAKVFATEDGIKCKSCFKVTETVPEFIASGSWSLFGIKENVASGDN